MHVKSKSKGSGLRTHGANNQGSKNDNGRGEDESALKDSVSREWEENDSHN